MLLGRIIVANANARRCLGSTPMRARIVADGTLRRCRTHDVSSLLDNLDPSLAFRSNSVKDRVRLGKLGGSCVLVVVGKGEVGNSMKKRGSLGRLGPTGVRHVRVMGKTTSSLCNDSTVTKIVGVVAGHGHRGVRLAGASHVNRCNSVHRDADFNFGCEGVGSMAKVGFQRASN